MNVPVSNTLPRRLRRLAALVSLGLVLAPAMLVSANDEWQPDKAEAPDRCDGIPVLPPLPDESSPARPVIVPPAELYFAPPFAPIVPSHDDFLMPLPPAPRSMDPQDRRLRHLRSLFGELRQQLDKPLLDRQVVTPQPTETGESMVAPVDATPPLPTSVDVIEDVPHQDVLPPPATPDRDPIEELTPNLISLVIPEVANVEPANRLALADNLFAAGSHQLALNAYSALDLDQQSEADRYWIVLQLAACYRRLGDVSAASKHYRKLAAISDPVWVGELSRWWLKAIETQRAIGEQTGELRSMIEELQEVVREDLGT